MLHPSQCSGTCTSTGNISVKECFCVKKIFLSKDPIIFPHEKYILSMCFDRHLIILSINANVPGY